MSDRNLIENAEAQSRLPAPLPARLSPPADGFETFPELIPPLPREQALQIRWISRVAELEAYSSAWDRLVLQSPQKLPMLSCSWLLAYFSSMLKPPEKWECALVFEAEELVAGLPLICIRRPLLGSSLRTPYDLHTRSGDAIVKTGYEFKVLPALRKSIGLRYPQLRLVVWRGVVEDSPTLFSLNVNDREIPFLSRSTGKGSFLPISGSFADYKNRLNRNFRGNLRKAHNKAEGRSELLCLTGEAAAKGEHLETFLRLEASGWKGKRGTAILLNPVLVQFYSLLVRRLAARQWLEWHFFRLDGRIIAAHLAVRLGRTLTLLKIAYDEDFSCCAPGNQLFFAIVEQAYAAADTDRIDCLTDMPWNSHWKMVSREYFDLFFYPRKILPFILGYLPHRIYLRLKSEPAMLKTIRQLKKGMQQLRKRFGSRLPSAGGKWP